MTQNDLAPLLGRCSHMVKRRINESMQCYDITPVQAHAMIFLIRSRAQEETTQQELERFLMIRPSTVNGVVLRLEEKGFITRRSGKTDKRRRGLVLTEKGLALEQIFYEALRQGESLMLQGFTPEESETLHRLLLRVSDNLALPYPPASPAPPKDPKIGKD